MKKSVFKSLLLLCTTSLLCACVNEEYDLNKEIDNNITILKNIGIPIGNLEPITIEDFISSDNQDVLKTESNGDFYFSIDGEYISEDLSFLNLDITDNNFRTNDISILFPTSSFSGLGGLLPDLTLNYSDVIGSPLNTTIDFEVDSPVATGITDVKSVDVDAIVYVDFSISSGACYLKSGFKLKLPDNLHFTLLDNSGKFTLTSNNILTVSNDCKVSGNTPLRVKLKVDKITVPSNSVKDGNLQIADNIVLSGDFYVKTNDFTSIPSNLEVLINFSVHDVNVKSAVVSINLSETFEGATMEIPELPDFLMGSDIVLDLYNPMINLQVNNVTPLPVDVHTTLVMYQTQSEQQPIVSFNPFGDNDTALSIAANNNSRYLISRRAVTTESDVMNIVRPELSEVCEYLSSAYSLGVKELRVSSEASDITIDMTKELTINVDYEIKVPIAFGENVNINFTYDIEDFSLDAGLDIESVRLSLDVVNSLPMTFALSAQALDSEMNPQNSMTLSVDKAIASGTHESPTETPINIVITNKGGEFNIGALRLYLKATAPSPEHIGVSFNRTQGLQIKNLSLYLPDGLTLDLK